MVRDAGKQVELLVEAVDAAQKTEAGLYLIARESRLPQVTLVITKQLVSQRVAREDRSRSPHYRTQQVRLSNP